MVDTSLLTTQPSNSSLIQPQRFTFVIPTLPFVRYFCQSVNIPGVRTSEIVVPTPFVKTWRHGEQLEFDPLTITVLVDEDMKSYEETYHWLRSLAKLKSFDDYARKDLQDSFSQLYHDAVLTLNTNANVPNVRWTFRDCHPVALGELRFDTAQGSETILTCDITFRFDYWEVERLRD